MSKRAVLYQQFDPARPLEADEEKLYVDWQNRLGLDDVKVRLAESIALSGSFPVCRLFTGNRGVGKTTELKRIKKRLQEGGAEGKRFVCLLEAERWMHLEDVTPTDIVFHMVRQIVDDLGEAGFGFGWTKLTGLFGEISELLRSDVELRNIKIPVGVAEFSLALKDNPVVRGTLRKLLDGHLPNIYQLVNEVILTEARNWLREKQGYEDILVIADQLDRIPRKVINEQGLTNHENLFLDHAGQLRFLSCDVLYTVPIELAYSRCRERLKSAYAAEILTLPVIPVSRRSGEVHVDGMEALREIVRQRAESAGLSLAEFVAEPALLERLGRLSGGHIRNLFILIRASIERCPTLPVTSEAVERTVRQQAADLGLPIGSQEKEALMAVHAGKAPYEKDPDLWYELLRDQLVFTYADSQGLWYDWSPLFGELWE